MFVRVCMEMVLPPHDSHGYKSEDHLLLLLLESHPLESHGYMYMR